MKIDKSLILPVQKIIQETARVKSFYFNYCFKAKPGQFIMVWLPKHDEKPFGVIVKNKSQFLISAANVGKTTHFLHQIKEGDKLGIRGPYGSYFKLPAGKPKIILIAGGYGMAPLAALAKKALDAGYKVDILIGAKTKKDLLIYSWLKNKKIKYYISTDDGSLGFSGLVTDLFIDYLKKNTVENKHACSLQEMYVYIVGPELMEKKIAEICYQNKIPFQLSIERYIKCAVGICGQCCVDSEGWRMCVEGPVINYKKLKKISEFGKYKRIASGAVQTL